MVVDQKDGRGEQAERRPGDKSDSIEPADRQPIGAADGEKTEKDEDEQLAEGRGGDGARAAGIKPTAKDGNRAADQDRPAASTTHWTAHAATAASTALPPSRSASRTRDADAGRSRSEGFVAGRRLTLCGRVAAHASMQVQRRPSADLVRTSPPCY